MVGNCVTQLALQRASQLRMVQVRMLAMHVNTVPLREALKLDADGVRVYTCMCSGNQVAGCAAWAPRGKFGCCDEKRIMGSSA